MTTENRHCSFCGKAEQEVKHLIEGENAYICNECVETCGIMLEGGDDAAAEGKGSATDGDGKLPTPSEIVANLNDHVIGQEQAKKALAVAVYNHYKRLRHPKAGGAVELSKSNILLIGPTGSGKTLLAQSLARKLDVPFVMADATTLTEAGYVGEDVEQIITKLLGKCILFICGGAFAGLEKVIRQRTEKGGIGFGAAVHSKDENADISELFEIVEPEDLIKFGLIPELIGRLPVIATLAELDEDALINILTEPKNALVKQYQALFAMEGAELEFEPDALRAIAKLAMTRKTGARGLRSIVERALLETMYRLPNLPQVKKAVITAEVIENNRQPVLLLADGKEYQDDAQ